MYSGFFIGAAVEELSGTGELSSEYLECQILKNGKIKSLFSKFKQIIVYSLNSRDNK